MPVQPFSIWWKNTLRTTPSEFFTFSLEWLSSLQMVISR